MFAVKPKVAPKSAGSDIILGSFVESKKLCQVSNIAPPFF